MRTYWLHMLYDYCYEKDTPYSYNYDFWPDWLYQYFNEMPLGEAIESAYLTWKLGQHILEPKYHIMR